MESDDKLVKLDALEKKLKLKSIPYSRINSTFSVPFLFYSDLVKYAYEVGLNLDKEIDEIG